jgi:hypothetical protein
LLSIAAIIFVAVQGESVNGTLRFAILSTYALGFLGLGLGLHRWERVREAGPVFLALGAVLVPIDFIALRTQVLSNDQMPNDVLWFFASGACAALYFALATRGYGWLYALPGVPAALVAWGSLGSIVNLPNEWFGPWFAAVAAGGYVAGAALWPTWRPGRWLLGFSAVLGASAIAWTQSATTFTGEQPWALPAAYVLGTAALAAGLYWRRDTAALLALPALASAVAASAWWAAFGLGVEWRAPFVAAAGAGYLVVAHFRPEQPARRWATLSAVLSVLALAIVHTDLAVADSQRGALPATYAVVFASAAGAFGRWRWPEAGAVLPPLMAMLLATTQWAARGVNVEWYGSFAGLAALGYLALAAFDRPARAPGWQVAAAVTACIGPAMAHVAIATNADASRWALVVSYLPPLVGAALAFLRWRWAWRLAPGALPVLTAMAALAFAWAQWDLQREWFPVFAAAAGLGYLALAQFDDQRMARMWGGLAAAMGVLALAGGHSLVIPEGAAHAALPAAYALVLVGVAAAFARWRWPEAGAALPPVAAATALTMLWATIALDVEWYGSFAAAAGLGYLLIAHFGDQRLARMRGGFAAVAGLLALASAHTAVLPEGAFHAALPVTYALVLFGVSAAFARWRWIAAGAALPPAAAMTALTALWASVGLGVEWYGSFAAAAALGYLLMARFDKPERLVAWQSASIAAALLGLALAHSAVATETDPERFALPVTYGVVLAGAAAAALQWRLSWRVAPGVVPLLAAMTSLTGLWAGWDMRVWWFGAFFAAAAVGYVLLAAWDGEAWMRTWLRFGGLVCGAGLAFAQASQGRADAEHVALPVAYGIGLAVAVIAATRFRLAYLDGVAAIPALAAAFGASAGWALFDMRLEWLPAWAAFAAAGYAVPTIIDARNRDAWRALSFILSIGALVGAHEVAPLAHAPTWQLPASYLVILIGWSVQAVMLRDISTLLPPVLVSALGATALWAADVAPQWWSYPALGVAAVMMATGRWWEPNRVLGAAGWLYAVALASAAAIAVLPFDYSHPAHGVAVQLFAAALLLFASIRSRGRVVRAVADEAGPAATLFEWAVLTQAAFAFVFGAAASLNGVLDLTGADRAWVFTAPALLGWALTATGVRGRAGWRTFAPAGLVGMTIAAIAAAPSDGTVTAILALATLGPLTAFAGTRRWMFLGIANSALFLAVWTGWRWQEIDMAFLPLGFAAIAAIEWGALTALRKYTSQPGERDLVITYISWAPWLLSASVSGLLLSQKEQDLAAGNSLVNTQEWGLAAAVLGLVSASIAAEGLRLVRRWIWIPGTLGILVALLMAIATRQPENIQAYTAPTGVYLIAVMLTFKASPRLFRDQMSLHEAVMIAGALALVLPPAEQSFEPGGGKFGLELLGIGLGILAVGLLFHARWLVAAAVATLTATALRMVTGGLFSTPYWLLLGIAGTALLLLGLLVLLERERWDRLRAAVVKWWEEASRPEPPGIGGPPRPAH